MLVVWNPNAGSVEAANNIRDYLMKRPKTDVVETQSAEDAAQLVANRTREGETEIVAAGGDGTINAVINGMMKRQHDATLGVLPLGTANDWCSSLGVPDNLNAALQLIESGYTKEVDVIAVETPSERRYFANIATGGNSHRVTESITTEMKQTWGALCYLRGTIGILSDLRSFRTSISFDGGTSEEFDAWNVIVANGKTSGGRLEVAPSAQLDDGLMDIVIIRDGTLLDLAGMTFDLLTSRGAYIASDQVEYRKAETIKIQSNPQLLFSIDGDLVEQQPVKFHCCPKSLRVTVENDDESRSTR